MSYTKKITNELIRSESLKANTKILLLVLMTYENDNEGYSYPTHDQLMKTTGLSKNTLIKCLNELEEKKYIKRVRSSGVNNRYYISENIEELSSIKIDTDIKNNTGSSIKIDTRGSIKNDTLQVLYTSNKKEKEKNKTNLDKIIEAYTENDSLKETIKDFIKMRKTIKKPVTDRSLKLTLNKLDQYGRNDLEKIEILENSIMNCWQGVFELKNKKEPIAVGPKNKNIKVNPSICNNTQKYSRGVEML